MLYVFLEIIFFLVLATILGLFFGWLFAKRKYANAETSPYSGSAFAALDEDNASEEDLNENINRIIDDSKAEIKAEYDQKIDNLESKVSEYENKVNSYNLKIQDYETKLEIMENEKNKLEKQMASNIMGNKDFIASSPSQQGRQSEEDIISKISTEEIDDDISSNIADSNTYNADEDRTYVKQKKQGLLSVFRDRKTDKQQTQEAAPEELKFKPAEKPAPETPLKPEVKEFKAPEQPTQVKETINKTAQEEGERHYSNLKSDTSKPRLYVPGQKTSTNNDVNKADSPSSITKEQESFSINAPKKFEPAKNEPKIFSPKIENRNEPNIQAPKTREEYTPSPSFSQDSVTTGQTAKPATRNDSLKIETIEGIGKAIGSKLRNMNINTTNDLLSKIGRNKSMIEKVSANTNVSVDVVSRWVSMADLLRIPGVDKQFAELLNVADVRNIQNVAKCNEGELQAKMLKVNADTPVSPEVPTLEQVKEWKQLAANINPRIDL